MTLTYNIATNCVLIVDYVKEDPEDDEYFTIHMKVVHNNNDYNFEIGYEDDYKAKIEKFITDENKNKLLYLHIYNGGPTIIIKDGEITMENVNHGSSFYVKLNLIY